MSAFDSFYSSAAWQETRKAFAKSKKYLCERCLARGLIVPGVIVHHKQHINAKNINDPQITLNRDNLQLLCRDCHSEVHRRQKRYTVDNSGRVTSKES